MQRYILHRFGQAAILLFLLSIGLFLFVHLLPGGPEAVLFNPRLSGAARRALAHYYGIDQPLPIQYIAYISHLFQGDLYSFSSGRPVLVEIGDRVPATLELFSAALGFALVMAMLLGVLSATYQYSLLDYLITTFSYLGIAMPVFWFGLLTQQILGVQLHVLPVYGRASLDMTGFTLLDVVADYLVHLILPALVLSLGYLASWSRYLRASMLDTLKQDYIRTARSKGVHPAAVIARHALHNALLPFVTVVALGMADVAGGAVVTETLFGWPGIGRLFYDSVAARDYPVLLTLLLFAAAVIILMNLVADVLYALLDPRIRYS